MQRKLKNRVRQAVKGRIEINLDGFELGLSPEEVIADLEYGVGHCYLLGFRAIAGVCPVPHGSALLTVDTPVSDTYCLLADMMFYTKHTIRNQVGLFKWESAGWEIAWFHVPAVADGEEVS